MELLLQQVVKFMDAGIVNEYHMWKNTTDQDDIEWMYSKQSDTVKVIEPDVPHAGNLSIYDFFKRCTNDNTIYIRFDDDIVLLDTIDAFKKYIDFRIDNPDYFIVYPTILNNAIVSHILQRAGKISLNAGISGYQCVDDIGWKDPKFAANLHDEIIKKLEDGETLSYFHMCDWKLYYNERVSINGISWIGSDFRNLCNGVVGIDEELELSVEMPKRFNKLNCIYGGFVIVHYAFHTQRELLDSSGYLNKYIRLLKNE
jgi:hypothetical protein